MLTVFYQKKMSYGILLKIPIAVSETKLDNTVYDSEVAIDGYNILQCDRNRNNADVAYYFRNSICFDLKTCLCTNIENIFIDLLFPKTKPITTGIIYKPPNQTKIFEQIITEFERFDLNDEHYILEDFNINLLFKGKYIFDNQTNLASSIKNFHWTLKNILSFVRHTALSS